MKKVLLLIFVIQFSISIFAQVENVDADSPVYSFLKTLNVKGVIINFDDITLPLTKKVILEKLNEAESRKNLLSSNESTLLDLYLEKYKTIENPLVFAQNFPSTFTDKFTSGKQKHLYYYADSTVTFRIDPVLKYTSMYSKYDKKSTQLVQYGGIVRLSYDNWLGAYLKADEGIKFGDRNLALFNQDVRQSFTYTVSKLNYFDHTEGYLLANKGIVNFELGRERNLWGTGYIDRMVLSGNPQTFDFVKFGIGYKSLRYDFIHGWLVHPAVYIDVDSVNGNVRTKPSKYIAMSRLSWNPFNNFYLGVSQIIIYSDRPLEAAYLNPFLFWESAQRSLNDLDNSFLSFDIRSKIVNGMELSSSLIMDDINTAFFKKGNWDDIGNRFAWQIGGMFTNPILFNNFSLKAEYTLLRPYIFSHYGLTKYSLTYTNNGEYLGIDMPPNSTRLAFAADYLLTGRINISAQFKHTLHGNNIYDASGSLVKSVGGDIFRPMNAKYDGRKAPLLAGELETINAYSFGMNYEIIYGTYLGVSIYYRTDNVKGVTNKLLIVQGSLRINFDY